MTDKAAVRKDLAGLVDDLKGWAVQARESGRKRVDVDAETWLAFAAATSAESTAPTPPARPRPAPTRPVAPAPAPVLFARSEAPSRPRPLQAPPPPPPRPAQPAPAKPAVPDAAPAGPRDPVAAQVALDAVAARVASCVNCPLHQTRTRTVPGQGNPQPDLMFIGEGPGGDEDRQGLAFVGRAGQLLTRLITAMGLTRDEVFIGNIVKCRPTENYEMKKDRPPTEEEMAACIGYLEEQIAILKPRAIVALGGTAVRGLLGLTGITRLRGTWHAYRGVPVMPTYHPSYLLRGGGENNALFWDVWEDMVQVLQRLGKPVPEKKRPVRK